MYSVDVIMWNPRDECSNFKESRANAQISSQGSFKRNAMKPEPTREDVDNVWKLNRLVT